MVIVERASIMGVLGTLGGFVFSLFQGWSGERILGKCAAVILAFKTSSIYFRVAFH